MIDAAIMLGGGKKIKSILKGSKGGNNVAVMVMLVLFFILRVLVVQYTYNKVAPRLISNLGNPKQQFKPLTFDEALLFTLLITFLF